MSAIHNKAICLCVIALFPVNAWILPQGNPVAFPIARTTSSPSNNVDRPIPLQAQTQRRFGSDETDNSVDSNHHQVSRRHVFQKGWLDLSAMAMSAAIAEVVVTSPTAANAGEDIRGIPLTPFNGLIFNYKGSDFAGLDAATLKEPSISYQEFVSKLKSGQVEFVEFLAPDGDAAYVTLKDDKNSSGSERRIRIGEGYPIEQHDGWSSPAFAIRTVVNEGVPYKFIVPGLAKYK